MIKFQKNRELDIAMRNLILSMADVNEYITNVLNYTEKILTPQKERALIKVLKKYKVPHDSLKYDSKILIIGI